MPAGHAAIETASVSLKIQSTLGVYRPVGGEFFSRGNKIKGLAEYSARSELPRAPLARFPAAMFFLYFDGERHTICCDWLIQFRCTATQTRAWGVTSVGDSL